MIFQSTHSSSGSWVVCQSLFRQLRVQGGYPPWTGCPSITTNSTLRLGQSRHANEPHAHISGMWEETGALGENLCRHEENVQIQQTGVSGRKTIFSHKHYNEMTLIKDLLYSIKIKISPLCVPFASPHLTF